MVNHFVVPPVARDFDTRFDVQQMKNDIAEYLHAFAPAGILQAYASACSTPSILSTRAAFETMKGWLESRLASDPNAEFVLQFVREGLNDFEKGLRRSICTSPIRISAGRRSHFGRCQA